MVFEIDTYRKLEKHDKNHDKKRLKLKLNCFKNTYQYYKMIQKNFLSLKLCHFFRESQKKGNKINEQEKHKLWTIVKKNRYSDLGETYVDFSTFPLQSKTND